MFCLTQVNHQASQQQSKIAEEQLESMFRSLTLAGNNQRAAEKEVAGLQEKLASAQVRFEQAIILDQCQLVNVLASIT